jgi:protease I
VPKELQGKTIAFLVAPEGVEQVELTEPWKAIEDAGGTPRLVSTRTGTIQAFHHLDKADTFDVDATVGTGENDVTVDEFDGLVLPGGVANPDQLRTQPAAVAFARGFFTAGKPVAVICHGGWILIEVDAVDARRITSWPSLATDFRNAGAEWVDEQLVVDTNGPFTLISSRKPDDLPAFCQEIVSQF